MAHDITPDAPQAPSPGNALEAFLDAGEDGTAEAAPRPGVVRDLLVFEYAADLYAVPASQVASVVPWRDPVPMPGADPRVRGVIQDRGRIIVLMSHPTGRAHAAGPSGTRVVVCATARGFVGLPATTTRAVGPVALSTEPAPFTMHEGGSGTFTYLDPSRYPEE